VPYSFIINRAENKKMRTKLYFQQTCAHVAPSTVRIYLVGWVDIGTTLCQKKMRNTVYIQKCRGDKLL
jgi:hypothetical protein